jgi:tetratricopeptide (TPR) repeat protein
MAHNDIDAAQQAWEESLLRKDDRTFHSYAVDQRWIIHCLYKKSLFTEAQTHLHELSDSATLHNLHRSQIFCAYKLASIALEQGDIEGAEQQLVKSKDLAASYQDREYIAEIQYLYARLYLLYGDHLAAHAALGEAIDLFERLGMRNELVEARTLLAYCER